MPLKLAHPLALLAAKRVLPVKLVKKMRQSFFFGAKKIFFSRRQIFLMNATQQDHVSAVLGKISPQLDREEANRQHIELCETLKSVKWVKFPFISGSYARGTAVHPINDVDIFAVMDKAEKDTPRAALRRLKREIKKALPACETRIQDHSVRVQFPGAALTLDVVPAFQHNEGFHIPENSTSSFVFTNPRAAKVEADRLNAATSGMFSQLVRLAKHWNVTHNKQIKSFHLELLAYKFARTQPSPLQATFLVICTPFSPLSPARSPTPSILLAGGPLSRWSKSRLGSYKPFAGLMGRTECTSHFSQFDARKRVSTEQTKAISFSIQTLLNSMRNSG